jgi:hypothetical protein
MAVKTASQGKSKHQELADLNEEPVRLCGVLNAINTIFKEALNCITGETLANTCLEVAQNLKVKGIKPWQAQKPNNS